MREIFYMAGLPRSGSTLLMNLMAQNPNVFCTPTSGLHQLLNNTKITWNDIIEHRADKNAGSDENLKRILKSTLYNYHNTDKPIIVDKCRGWGFSIEMLETITDKRVKIIAPVRDLPEVFASFESLYRKGSYKFNPQGLMPQGLTMEGRTTHWGSLDGEVGVAYSILKDAFQRGLGDRFLLVDYDYLTRYPQIVMDSVWNFLEIPKCEHDFDNVINQTPEDDGVYNYVDLHKIRSKVSPSIGKAEQILGRELCDKLSGYEFWKNV